MTSPPALFTATLPRFRVGVSRSRCRSRPGVKATASILAAAATSNACPQSQTIAESGLAGAHVGHFRIDDLAASD
jgi:hypothetical protein